MSRRLGQSRAALCAVLLSSAVACGDPGGGAAVPDGAPASDVARESSAALPWFAEGAAASGIDFTWESGKGEKHYFPEIMGGGVALFDMDGDRDLDAYFVQGGNLHTELESPPGNVLYENVGGRRFRDVSEGSGAQDARYGMGVALGDYDGDGREDLFVTNLGRNTLLRNLGGGEFADVTLAAGLTDEDWSTSAAFLDYDRDGDLDLFVVNYLKWSFETELECRSSPQPWDYCSPKSYAAPAPDALYRNEGDGTFTNVSVASGLRMEFGNGLGIVCGDFDGDGFQDVFVANDGMKNQLWLNAGGERFLDAAVRMGCAVDQDGLVKAGMGTHAADLDDDGDEDLLVVNLNGEPASFCRTDGAFVSDRTQVTGLGSTSRAYTRFGLGFVDFDNDGRLDLYQANGRVTRATDPNLERPYDQENLVFRCTVPMRFEEVTPRGGVATALSATSRAAAFGDLDGDGGVDVVVVNRDTPAHVLWNQAAPEANRWIAFRVLEASGRAALGAELTLRVGERSLFRTVRSGYSYCAANDPKVHVGLGAADGVTEVAVTWGDGTREVFGDFSAGGVVELTRGAGR